MKDATQVEWIAYTGHPELSTTEGGACLADAGPVAVSVVDNSAGNMMQISPEVVATMLRGLRIGLPDGAAVGTVIAALREPDADVPPPLFFTAKPQLDAVLRAPLYRHRLGCVHCVYMPNVRLQRRRFSGVLWKPLFDSLSVHVFSVTDSYDTNDELLVLNLVDDPVHAASQSILLLTGEFPRLRRTRIIGQCPNGLDDASHIILRHPFEVLGNRLADDDPISSHRVSVP